MEEAFVQIIKENEGLIFKISSVYTNDETDRQDLYQEIVLQLWKSFGSFRQESKVSTWMYRVALNTAISRLRKEKKNGNRVPIDQVVLDISENKDHEYQERVTELYRHIERLNDLEKGVILLVLEDKSYDEISSITGLTVSNVGTRISRIKDKLRKQVSKT